VISSTPRRKREYLPKDKVLIQADA